MADMLMVSALELGNPVLPFIPVIADDASFHTGSFSSADAEYYLGAEARAQRRQSCGYQRAVNHAAILACMTHVVTSPISERQRQA
jgi:hypothetical protein